MLLTQRIIDYAQRYRMNRERRRLEEILSSMPQGVRKDLGWPTPVDLGPDTSCKRRGVPGASGRRLA
ncbi:hypothetical protein DFR52_104308 [Hoeflea marina]|uniref:Uncharacterized protein n=1 Tax=Hoeflea marina TaxID=274592 RepID=A0A317PII6_9HYPH|nr:hypothetical protein [Hoeflea marina]PWV99017.1 hypothetical protein DFR52_104308 [Hoeflea marina]